MRFDWIGVRDSSVASNARCCLQQLGLPAHNYVHVCVHMLLPPNAIHTGVGNELVHVILVNRTVNIVITFIIIMHSWMQMDSIVFVLL